LQQQVLTLRSQKAPKLTALQQASSGAGQASELAALQQQALTLQNRTSSGVCYVAAASSHALELGALQGLVVASKLRSREAPEKLQSLELACLFKQNKQK
jgi:hypothetical protein